MPRPWWTTDTYDDQAHIPAELVVRAGPQGVALVRLWPTGKTDAGWGESQFMTRYTRKFFAAPTILAGYLKRRWNFAFVMRSMKVVCIDIDGKNDGEKGALALGMLPHTLAETSKSGNGYHLFYATDDDVWDEDKGYAMFGDRISLQQGVDFRGIGCVYHYPQQMWNGRDIAELPDHLKDMLKNRQDAAEQQIAVIIQTLDEGDEDKVLIMQDALVADLAKPIPQGRRNTTLFAIGQQMHAAGVQDWDDLLYSRAIQVGLDHREANKIVANVIKYAVKP